MLLQVSPPGNDLVRPSEPEHPEYDCMRDLREAVLAPLKIREGLQLQLSKAALQSLPLERWEDLAAHHRMLHIALMQTARPV